MDAAYLSEMEKGRLAAVIEAAVDGMIAIDEVGIVMMYSPSCERIFGYGAEEVVGHNVKMLMPEPYQGEHDGYLANYMKTGDKKIIGIGREVVGRRKDGSTFPMNLSVGEFSESGDAGFVGIIHDLTDQKRREDLSRRLSRIVERSVNEIYMINAETLQFQTVNQSARRNLGYSADEFSSMTPLDIKPEFTAESFAELLRPLRDGTETLITFNTVHQRKDGSRYDVEVHLQLMAEEDPPMFAAILKDITEINWAQAALAKSEAALARAQKMAGLGSWERDLRTGEVHCSTQLMRNFGRDTDDVSHEREELISSMIHPDDRDLHRATIMNLGSNGTIAEETLRVVRPDGETAYLRFRFEGETDDNGELVRILGTALDITQAKKTEEALTELQAELNHATQLTAANEMAAALSHELNQPLSAIVNYAEACRTLLEADSVGNKEKISEYISRAAEQSHRAGDIIRHLREFTEKGETEQRPENINEVVQEACDLFLRDAPDRGVTVITEYGKNLSLVMMDRIQIQQVVTNLVRNAIDAMNEVPIKRLTIKTNADANGGVVVSVADTGPGLSDEVAGNLFKPFTTTKSTGMGMGLSISQSIIEAHDGEIEATPNEAGGVTFSFTLPGIRSK